MLDTEHSCLYVLIMDVVDVVDVVDVLEGGAQPVSPLGQQARGGAFGVHCQPFVFSPNSCLMARAGQGRDLVFARRGNDERL